MDSKTQYIKNKQKQFYIDKYKKANIAYKTKNKILKIFRENEFGRILCAYKSRIRNTLLKCNKNYKFSYENLIGCNEDEFIKYIISNFKKDMTIENFGEWQMDHIIPISSFNLLIEEEIMKCYNYKNIQLLWKEENLKKSNKII